MKNFVQAFAYRFGILTLTLTVFCASSFAQMVGTDIFLPGHWVEIGQSNVGAFGTTSVPVGYHPQGTLTNLAEVYDYGHDGWTIGTPPEYGDYTYPGLPFEGWELQVNGLRNQAFDGSAISGTGSLTGNNFSYSNSGGRLTALWQGTASGGNLSINQTTILDTNASWVVVTTVLKNTSGAAIPSIYYLRTCDPDNEQTLTGAYSTNNTITYQNDANHRVLISARGTSVSNSYLGLGTKDCRAKALTYATWPIAVATDLATVWSQTFAGTYTGTATGDIAIGLIYNIGTIAAGDSTIISYAYIFNDSTGIDSAFPEPKLVTLGTSHSATDTVTGCMIAGTTLPVSITNATDKAWARSQWNWSPALGLSSTTGINNVVDFSAISGSAVVYTITGTNPAMGDCASKTFLLTIDATVLHPVAGIISGASNICVGATTPLTDATPGGTWSVSNTTASISATGLLTGLAVGIDTITYMVSNICGVALTNFTDTISAPANSGFIVGPDTVCAASFAVLTDTATGGVWSCSNANGTISVTGLFSALLTGLDTIYYSVVTGCGSSVARKIIYIRPLPNTGVISGPTSVCVGSTINLTETVPGGVWSSAIGLTSISPLGVVTGLTAGIDTIKYSVTNICGTRYASWIVTVNPIGAGIISGPSVACVGTSVTLTDAIPSGTFSSGNLNATITSGGILTGINPGTDTITYTVVSVCGIFSTTKVITVEPLPNAGAISGDSTVCQNATITLSETISGGVWGSSNNIIASVDSTLGIVSGLSGGIVNINYYVTSAFGCVGISSYSVLVNPAPFVNAITGITNQCVGSTSILTDITPSGIWSSSNITKATINTAGVVTGISQGIVTITYSITDMLGCIGIATTPDTVNTIPVPTPILGSLQACIAENTTLYDSTLWGVWISADTTIATINAATGVVTGVSVGSVKIYYIVTNNCGSVTDSAIVTVNALPTVQPINAPGVNICAGGSALLTDATTGGTWSSSNTAIATVISTTGWVTGIAAGLVTITYTVTNSLGCSANTTTDLTFGGSLSASVLPSGTASLCHTGFIHMYVVSSASGLNYQWIRYSTLIPGATQNYYNASVAGNYAVEVGNSICSETVAGTSITTLTHPIISFVSPNILYTGSYYTYQWLLNGSPIAGATTSVYSALVNGNYQVAVSNSSGCLDTSSVFAVTDLTGVNIVTFENSINYYPNPATSIINIDAPQKINVQILSPDGKVIIDEKNAKEINISTLRSGLYIIRIFDQQNTILKTGKFTKL